MTGRRSITRTEAISSLRLFWMPAETGENHCGRNTGSLTENVLAMLVFYPCSVGFGGNLASRRRRVTEKGKRTGVRGVKEGERGKNLKKEIG